MLPNAETCSESPKGRLSMGRGSSSRRRRFVASEARRSERIYGVSLSIPLSGTYRNERMLQSLQEAEAAQ